jgi:streptogramin lyase
MKAMLTFALRAIVTLAMLAAGVVAARGAAAGASPSTVDLGRVDVVSRGIAEPSDVTVAGDGAVWFTNSGSDSIGRAARGEDVRIFTGIGVHRPTGITTGPDGNLWFANTGSRSIGRMTPDGAVSVFEDPAIAAPDSIATAHGRVWFTNTADNSIGSITPTGDITLIRDPNLLHPTSMAVGPFGDAWFASADQPTLGHVTADGRIIITTVGLNVAAGHLASSPDGGLWFLAGRDGDVGRLEPDGTARFLRAGDDGHPIELAADTAGHLWYIDEYSQLWHFDEADEAVLVETEWVTGPVTFAPDGGLWVVETSRNAVGRMDTTAAWEWTSGPVRPWDAGPPWNPAAVEGPDGALYVGQSGLATIGRIARDGTTSTIALPGAGYLPSLVLGPGGAVWFKTSGPDVMGFVDANGEVTTFAGPDFEGASAMALGPDDRMWFTVPGFGRISSVSPDGDVRSYPVGGAPRAITRGADGAMWFSGRDSIVRITPSGDRTTFASGTSWTGTDILVTGGDGNLWFVVGDGLVRRMTTTGDLTTFSDPRINQFSPLVVDTAGRMWFVYIDAGGLAAVANLGLDGLVTPFHDSELDRLWRVAPSTAGGLWFFTTGGTVGRIGPEAALTYRSLTPERIVDPRPAGPPRGPFTTSWAGGETRDVRVVGLAGVPVGARAVGLSVTVTNTTSAGYLTAWASRRPRPLVSSTNWGGGQTTSNAVTVPIGEGGRISLFVSAGRTDVLVDVVGYYDDQAGDGYVPMAPVRIQDTRPTGPQVGPYSTPWGPGTSRAVTVAGTAGVASSATAVILNVTTTNTVGAGYLTLWPTGQPLPLASYLNWTSGDTVARAVTVKVGTGGRVSVYAGAGGADVIIDVVGYFQAGSGAAFHPIAPRRVQDSRPGGPQQGSYSTPWGNGETRFVPVAAAGTGVPGTAVAALTNVTVTTPSVASHLTLWPSGGNQPLASTLNWRAGDTVANAATAKLGSAGGASVRNAAGVADVIIDTFGWYG